MKRKLTIIISMAFMLLSIMLSVACGDVATNNTQSTTCTHSYNLAERKATCSAGGNATYKCSLCSDTYTKYESALGHTTDSGTCTRCGQTFELKIWELGFYVDEFNNPTNEAYMRNSELIVGVFSNSATTDSKLYARILIDAGDVAIKLWEYGSQEVNAYSTTYYDITILDDAGNKHYTNGTMYKNGERIYFEDLKFISLLQQNEKLKIYIEEDSYGYNSTYLFEIKNGNFNTVYSDFYNLYIK